jgi:hypothetical protein
VPAGGAKLNYSGHCTEPQFLNTIRNNTQEWFSGRSGTSQASDVGSMPIAHSRNLVDADRLTGFHFRIWTIKCAIYGRSRKQIELLLVQLDATLLGAWAPSAAS